MRKQPKGTQRALVGWKGRGHVGWKGRGHTGWCCRGWGRRRRESTS